MGGTGKRLDFKPLFAQQIDKDPLSPLSSSFASLFASEDNYVCGMVIKSLSNIVVHMVKNRF